MGIFFKKIVRYISNRNIVLFLAVLVAGFYFYTVIVSLPRHEDIILPEVKIVNTNIQLDKETSDKLRNFELLLERAKYPKDSISLIRLKLSIQDLDETFFNKSKELNNIAKSNVDSIVTVLNKKISDINNVQNTISTVKEDYEYRTDLYQSLILFIVAIIGFFGYSNFKEIENKSKEIAKKSADKRILEYSEKKITEIVSQKAEEKVNEIVQGVAQTKFSEITKDYENQLDVLIKEKIESNVDTENIEITKLKAEIKALKEKIIDLEKN